MKNYLWIKLVAIVLLPALIVSEIAWAAPDIGKADFTLAPWLGTRDPKLALEARAKMYRARHDIQFADGNQRYLDLLAAKNQDAVQLESGVYLMRAQTAIDDLSLVRAIAFCDFKKRVEGEQMLAKERRSDRYDRLSSAIKRKIDELAIFQNLPVNDLVAKYCTIKYLIRMNVIVQSALDNEEALLCEALEPIIEQKDLKSGGYVYFYYPDGLFDTEQKPKPVAYWPAKMAPDISPAARENHIPLFIDISDDLNTITYYEVDDDDGVFIEGKPVNYGALKLRKLCKVENALLITPQKYIDHHLPAETSKRLNELLDEKRRYTRYMGIITSWDEHYDRDVWTTNIDTVFLLKQMEALGIFKDSSIKRAIEIGVGRGHISAALAARLSGLNDLAVTDISEYALECASRNIEPYNKNGSNINYWHGKGLKTIDGNADLIVVNPPYIPVPPWRQDESDPYRGTGLIKEMFEEGVSKLNHNNPNAKIVMSVSSMAQKDMDMYIAEFNKHFGDKYIVEKKGEALKVPLKIWAVDDKWRKWLVSEGLLEEKKNAEVDEEKYWHSIQIYCVRPRIDKQDTSIGGRVNEPEIITQTIRRAPDARDGFVMSREGNAHIKMKEMRETRTGLMPANIPNLEEILSYVKDKIAEFKKRADNPQTYWDKNFARSRCRMARRGFVNLLRLCRDNKLYAFDAVIFDKEDYCLAYGDDNEIGIARELLGMEKEILAELLLHESVCFRTGHETAREIQEKLFPENMNQGGEYRLRSKLKIKLRGLIYSKAAIQNGVDYKKLIDDAVRKDKSISTILIDGSDMRACAGMNRDEADKFLRDVSNINASVVLCGDYDAIKSICKIVISRKIKRGFNINYKLVLSGENGLTGVWAVPDKLNDKILHLLKDKDGPVSVDADVFLAVGELFNAGYEAADELLENLIMDKHLSYPQEQPFLSYEQFAGLFEKYFIYKREINDYSGERDEVYYIMLENLSSESMSILSLINLLPAEDQKRYFRKYLLEMPESGLMEALDILNDFRTFWQSPRNLLWELYLDSHNTRDENERICQILTAYINMNYSSDEGIEAIFDIKNIFNGGDIEKSHKALEELLRLQVFRENQDELVRLLETAPYKKETVASFALLNALIFAQKEAAVIPSEYTGESGLFDDVLNPAARHVYYYILNIIDQRKISGAERSTLDDEILLLGRLLDEQAPNPREFGLTWFSHLRRYIHKGADSSAVDIIRTALYYWKELDKAIIESNENSYIRRMDMLEGPDLKIYSQIMNNLIRRLHEEGLIESLRKDDFCDEILNIGKEDVLRALRDVNGEMPVKFVDKVEYMILLYYDFSKRYGTVSADIIPEIKAAGDLTKFMKEDYRRLLKALESGVSQDILSAIARCRIDIMNYLLSQKPGSGEEREVNAVLNLNNNLYLLGRDKMMDVVKELESVSDLSGLRSHADALVPIGEFILGSGLGGADFEEFLRELEKGDIKLSQLHDLTRALRSEIHKITRKINENMRSAASHIWDNRRLSDLNERFQKTIKTDEITDKYGFPLTIISEAGKRETEDAVIDNMIRDSGVLIFDEVLSRFNDVLEKELTPDKDEKLSAEMKPVENPVENEFFRFGHPDVIPRERLLSLWSKKGLNLITMTENGIPVPPGVIISSRLITEHETLNSIAFRDNVQQEIEIIRKHSRYPDLKLLLYARSGSAFLLPGLLVTIPNIGMNDKEAGELARISEDEWFAYDTYAEFIRSYAINILGIDEKRFQEVFDIHEKDKLTGAEMKDVCGRYKEVIDSYGNGQSIPETMIEQVMAAIDCVYSSWDSEGAKEYRARHRISQEWGTVVILQKGVFGNLNPTSDGRISGTGAAALMDLPDGHVVVQGKFRFRSIGEQIMSRAEQNYILLSNSEKVRDNEQTLEELAPEAYKEILNYAYRLKDIFGNNQHFEFTIERNKVWITQSNDDVIRDDYPEFIDEAGLEPVSRGHGVSGGALRGWAANTFESCEALMRKYESEKPEGIDGVILFLDRVNPELINKIPKGAHVIARIISVHAETLAQKYGITALYGIPDMKFNDEERVWYIGERKISDGTVISIDGHENQLLYHNSGKIFLGSVPLKTQFIGGCMNTEDLHRLIKSASPADLLEYAKRHGQVFDIAQELARLRRWPDRMRFLKLHKLYRLELLEKILTEETPAGDKWTLEELCVRLGGISIDTIRDDLGALENQSLRDLVFKQRQNIKTGRPNRKQETFFELTVEFGNLKDTVLQDPGNDNNKSLVQDFRKRLDAFMGPITDASLLEQLSGPLSDMYRELDELVRAYRTRIYTKTRTTAPKSDKTLPSRKAPPRELPGKNEQDESAAPDKKDTKDKKTKQHPRMTPKLRALLDAVMSACIMDLELLIKSEHPGISVVSITSLLGFYSGEYPDNCGISKKTLNALKNALTEDSMRCVLKELGFLPVSLEEDCDEYIIPSSNNNKTGGTPRIGGMLVDWQLPEFVFGHTAEELVQYITTFGMGQEDRIREILSDYPTKENMEKLERFNKLFMGYKNNSFLSVIKGNDESVENVFPTQQIETNIERWRESNDGSERYVPDLDTKVVIENGDDRSVSDNSGTHFPFCVIDSEGVSFFERKDRVKGPGIHIGIYVNAVNFNWYYWAGNSFVRLVKKLYRAVSAHRKSLDLGTRKNNGLVPGYLPLAFSTICLGVPSVSVNAMPILSTITIYLPANLFTRVSRLSVSQASAENFLRFLLLSNFGINTSSPITLNNILRDIISQGKSHIAETSPKAGETSPQAGGMLVDWQIPEFVIGHTAEELVQYVTTFGMRQEDRIREILNNFPDRENVEKLAEFNKLIAQKMTASTQTTVRHKKTGNSVWVLPGSIGVYTIGNLSMAFFDRMGAEFIIGKKKSKITDIIMAKGSVRVNGDDVDIRSKLRRGLVYAEKGEQNILPEVILVSPFVDELDAFIEELMEYFQLMDSGGDYSIDDIPFFLLASSGIYLEEIFKKIAARIESSGIKNKDFFNASIRRRVFRATAYQSGRREGTGLSANYLTRAKDESPYVILSLSGTEQDRARIFDIVRSRNYDIRIEDKYQMAEYKKALANLTYSAFSQLYAVVYEDGIPRYVDIKFRDLTSDSPFVPSNAGAPQRLRDPPEKIREKMRRMCKAYVDVCAAKGLYPKEASYEDEYKKLEKYIMAKFSHVVSSSNQILRAKVFDASQGWKADRLLPTEASVIDTLIRDADEHGLLDSKKILEDFKKELLQSYQEALSIRTPRYFPDFKSQGQPFSHLTKDNSADKIYNMIINAVKLSDISDADIEEIERFAFFVGEMENIREDAKKFTEYPMNCCKYTAERTFDLLISGGFKPKLILRDLRDYPIKSHYCVEVKICGVELIVDLTADQFTYESYTKMPWKTPEYTDMGVVIIPKYFVEQGQNKQIYWMYTSGTYREETLKTDIRSIYSACLTKTGVYSRRTDKDAKLRLCAPYEVVRNSGDLVETLKKLGGIDFELVIANVNDEDAPKLENLDAAETKKSLGISGKIKITVIREKEILETAKRYGYDPNDTVRLAMIMKDRYIGNIAGNEYIAITTGLLKKDDTQGALEALDSELSKNISFRLLTMPEGEDKAAYSISSILSDWLKAIDDGETSTAGILKLIPISAFNLEDVRRQIEAVWEVLSSS